MLFMPRQFADAIIVHTHEGLPSFACLSSRFPYGTTINREKVTQVGRAEESLRDLGLRTIRVRHHGDLARIELGPAEFERW
jgi:uncharacterized protein